MFSQFLFIITINQDLYKQLVCSHSTPHSAKVVIKLKYITYSTVVSYAVVNPELS